MKRRTLLKSWLGITGFIGAGIVATKATAKVTPKTEILLQTSPVAGFQYYQGNKVWQQLKVGETVLLKAETDNKYDKKAIEIYWQETQTGINHKLGYLPRHENHTISQLLQNNTQVFAKAKQLKADDNPWERILIDIFITV